MKQEFKAFNLEEALAGKPVVTREGKPVTQLVKFDAQSMWPLFAVVAGEIIAFKIDGTRGGHNANNPLDLFMAPEKKWTNLYYDPVKHDVLSGEICDSKGEALANCTYNKGGMKYIDTISFEI